jgi:hypothetical protein
MAALAGDVRGLFHCFTLGAAVLPFRDHAGTDRVCAFFAFFGSHVDLLVIRIWFLIEMPGEEKSVLGCCGLVLWPS